MPSHWHISLLLLNIKQACMRMICLNEIIIINIESFYTESVLFLESLKCCDTLRYNWTLV
jgi:hypothetical protein